MPFPEGDMNVPGSQDKFTILAVDDTPENLDVVRGILASKFTVESNLDTNTSPEAESTISDLIDGVAQKLLINFKQLNFIASSGLRVLLLTA
jgi:hypothetical protein